MDYYSTNIGFKWQRPNGSWINKKEIRKQLYKHQDGKCFYCKRKMSLNKQKNGSPARDFATFEHIERKQNGGKFNEANTVLACRVCNTQREIVRQSNNGKNRPKNMKPEKWKKIVEKWKQHTEGCQSG